MKKIFISLGLIFSGLYYAQVGYWQNDTTTKDQSLYVIKNITLYQDYKTVINDAVLVVQNGKILESGKVSIPKSKIIISIIPIANRIASILSFWHNA